MIFDGIMEELIRTAASVCRDGVDADSISNAMTISSRPEAGDVVVQVSKIVRGGGDGDYANALVGKLSELSIVREATVSGSAVFITLDKASLLRDIFYEVYNGEYDLNIGKGKRIIIEYSSPNIAKVFHVGHLRSTIIGNFLKNLHKKCGYDVVSINYLGDWGKQFGLVGVGYMRYGDDNQLKENALKHLFDVYVRISEDAKNDKSINDEARLFFKEMEDGKEKNLNMWRTFREMSVKDYKKVYKLLGVEFDVYSGESMYGQKGKDIVNNCPSVEVDEDGSKVVRLSENDAFIVLKNDGSSLYQTRDIAAAAERIKEYNPEKILYVVSNEQTDYFSKLKKVLKVMGIDGDKVIHVGYGLVLGMSTREGNVIFLEDVIKKTKESMLNVMKRNEHKFEEVADAKETAGILSVSGLIVQDFKSRLRKDYTFTMDRCTSIEGATGPYLQYTHCRLCSIEEKSGLIIEGINSIRFENIQDDCVQRLAFLLSTYPVVIRDCLECYEPHILLDYLIKVSKQVNFTIRQLRVVGEADRGVAMARLLMFICTRKVLRDGMMVLGIKPLEKM